MSPLRRLLASAAARDLAVFVVPDPDVARWAGLDLEHIDGLRVAATPRDASVLLIVGPIPPGLARAAAVIYAQMPRPRAILAVGTAHVDGLPQPDVVTELDQASFCNGIVELRLIIAHGAFRPDVVDFALEAVRTRTVYVCPMHPQIVQDAPGSCPICGMDLVPQETTDENETLISAPVEVHSAALSSKPAGVGAAEYTCPMHPEIVSDAPGKCPICGMFLVPRDVPDMPIHHAPADVLPHELSSESAEAIPTMALTEFTCPMHPEIVRNEPGNCPICGMTLVPREHAADDEAATTHASHAGDERSERSTVADPHGEHTHHAYLAVHDLSDVAAIADADQTTDHVTSDGMEAHSHAAHAPATDLAKPHDARQQHPMHADGSPHADHGEHHGAAMPVAAIDTEHQHALQSPSASADGIPAQDDHVMLSQHGTVDTAQMEHPVGPDQTERGEPSVDAAEHAGHAMSDDMVMDHSGHIDGGFMSMIAITKDLPRSRDGLPMEWIDVPFGPLFPGLPGGLALTLTLDGDTVAVAQVRPGAASRHLAATWLGPAATLPERLGTLDRLAPGAYATLAWQALASAGVASSDEAGQRARIGALERVRALSHLGWLSAFGRLLGYRWLEERAALLQLALLRAVDVADLAPVYDRIQRLAERIGRTPMLNRRLGGIGIIPPDGYGDWLTGPVARASGWKHDARVDDATYRALGFAPVMRHTGDALARLEVRLGEIVQSLDLLQAAGSWTLPVPRVVSAAAEALATLEMPRGQASTHVVLTGDEVSAVHVTVPSTMHVDILPVVAESVELADSLVAIASLDISPWEIDQ